MGARVTAATATAGAPLWRPDDAAYTPTPAFPDALGPAYLGGGGLAAVPATGIAGAASAILSSVAAQGAAAARLAAGRLDAAARQQVLHPSCQWSRGCEAHSLTICCRGPTLMAATGARRVLRAHFGRRRALGEGEPVAAARIVAGHAPPRLPAAAQPAAAAASVEAHVLLRQAHRHVTPSRRRCLLFLLFGGCRHLQFLHGGPQNRLQHEPQHDVSPRQRRRRRSRRAAAAAAAASGARVGHGRGPAPRRAELQVHSPPLLPTGYRRTPALNLIIPDPHRIASHPGTGSCSSNSSDWPPRAPAAPSASPLAAAAEAAAAAVVVVVVAATATGSRSTGGRPRGPGRPRGIGRRGGGSLSARASRVDKT